MADSSSTPSAGHNPEPESRPAQPDPSSISLPNPTPAPTGPLMQPSFRPAGPGTLFSLPTGAPAPQFSHVPYQAPAVPPPGVVPPPYVIAGQPMRYGPPMSNGYSAMPPGGFFSLLPIKSVSGYMTCVCACALIPLSYGF